MRVYGARLYGKMNDSQDIGELGIEVRVTEARSESATPQRVLEEGSVFQNLPEEVKKELARRLERINELQTQLTRTEERHILELQAEMKKKDVGYAVSGCAECVCLRVTRCIRACAASVCGLGSYFAAVAVFSIARLQRQLSATYLIPPDANIPHAPRRKCVASAALVSPLHLKSTSVRAACVRRVARKHPIHLFFHHLFQRPSELSSRQARGRQGGSNAGRDRH